jgi:hypothetical protein
MKVETLARDRINNVTQFLKTHLLQVSTNFTREMRRRIIGRVQSGSKVKTEQWRKVVGREVPQFCISNIDMERLKLKQR